MSQPATLALTAGIVLARALTAETVHMAVGSGDVAWDAETSIPQPTTAQALLLNELGRVVATLEYLDEDGIVTLDETNRIRFSGSFGIGVANGTIREVGIFAFGSGTIDTGLLIASINIEAIAKPAGGGDYTLSRLMRLNLLG